MLQEQKQHKQQIQSEKKKREELISTIEQKNKEIVLLKSQKKTIDNTMHTSDSLDDVLNFDFTR